MNILFNVLQRRTRVWLRATDPVLVSYRKIFLIGMGNEF
jgi:hypothetical protein